MTIEEIIDLESKVVNRVMDDPSTRDAILPILKPEQLADKAHQSIMKAIVSLSDDNLPIDMITVKDWLNKNEPRDNWAAIVGTLEVASFSEKPIHHARIIKEHYLRRSMQKQLEAALYNLKAENKDVFETLGTLSERIDDSINSTESSSFRSFAEIKEQSKNEIIKNESPNIVLSGLENLDNVTNGFGAGELIIIAARPSMGKSALMNTIAMNVASNGLPVYIFSLEMDAHQIVDRMVSGDVGIANGKIIRRNLDENERALYLDKIDDVDNLPIYVYDKGGINMRTVKSEARKAYKTTGVGAVFVDYMQLMDGSSKSGNREQEISGISRALKSLARELKCPVFALSQLSRACEAREFKIPQLSDLRESGAIEQDADTVLMLYRPARYGYTVLPFDISTNEEVDTVVEEHDGYVLVEKNRNGSVDYNARLNFQGIYTRFV